MATLQDVVTLARLPIVDKAGKHWDDVVDLLPNAIHGLLNAYRKRSDLFVGGVTKPTLAMTLASTFPLPDEYVQPLAEYVTARAQGYDDEHVNSGKFQAGLQMFTAEVPQ